MAPCHGINVFFKWLSVLSIFSCVYSLSFVLFGEISAQVLCPSLWWVTYVSALMYIWDRVSPHSPGWHSPGWPQTHNTVLASWVLELQVCSTRAHLNCWFLSCWSLRVIYIGCTLMVMARGADNKGETEETFFPLPGRQCKGKKGKSQASPALQNRHSSRPGLGVTVLTAS